MMEVTKGSAEYTQIKRFIDEMYAAWSTLNGDAAARFYAKDVDVIFYDMVPPIEGYTGWENINRGMMKNIVGTMAHLKLGVLDDSQFRVWQRGDLAYAHSIWRTDAKLINGQDMVIDGCHTYVLERRNGEWLIVHEHGSTPLPASVETVALHSEPLPQPNQDAEFKSLVDDWFATWNTLNPNAAERFYAKDDGLVFNNTFVFPPLGGYIGYDELKTGQQKAFANIETAKVTPYDDLHTWRKGDIAWTSNTFHISIKSKNASMFAETFEADARATQIWERRDEKWLLVHEHLSTSLIPSPSMN